MNKTKIEWVKNPDGTQGYTWNPITGCLNGCSYCYARKLANGRLRTRYLANSILPTHDEPDHQAHHQDPFYPRFWEDRLYEPCQSEKPKGIFVCDMGELFGDWVLKEWQDLIFSVIEAMPQHRFYLLTKQPQNLIKFSPFPDNCWVGVTATDDEMGYQAWRALKGIKASIKYISFEPLLGKMNIWDEDLEIAGIDWVIIGSQTKPYKPPKIEWVKEIVEACDKAGIPVFLKDNLEKLAFNYKWLEIEKHWALFDRIDHSDDLIIGADMRQEMPTIH